MLCGLRIASVLAMVLSDTQSIGVCDVSHRAIATPVFDDADQCAIDAAEAKRQRRREREVRRQAKR